MIDIFEKVFHRMTITREEYDDLHKQIQRLTLERDSANDLVDHLSLRIGIISESMADTDALRQKIGANLVTKIRKHGL